MTEARDPRSVVTDPDAGEPVETGHNEDPDTHTAALQGAAAGGMGGNTGASYAGGVFTGSEDRIGLRDIPDDEAEDDPPGTPTGG
jgi:hypothetical protein